MAHDDPHRFADIHEEFHRHLPSEPALRVKALESLLVEKRMLDPKAVDAWITVYTEEIGPEAGSHPRRQGVARSGLQAALVGRRRPRHRRAWLLWESYLAPA
jgi:hypothetical protein